MFFGIKRPLIKFSFLWNFYFSRLLKVNKNLPVRRLLKAFEGRNQINTFQKLAFKNISTLLKNSMKVVLNLNASLKNINPPFQLFIQEIWKKPKNAWDDMEVFKSFQKSDENSKDSVFYLIYLFLVISIVYLKMNQHLFWGYYFKKYSIILWR